ncbi:MAG: T9SS type B sorting domain-containing protein [Flavobacteriales bacterium]|jgi:gliding motility-associated-like protein|nr:T9SS type B sorting domain-containing protein [Flavobacteriales bacterium]MBT6916991.1 T9SS type B sorting domain-containing protein [Flavobacteriales bacterium]MBT6980509.1 T9SS type B sorting domain-containing protein [Flavobacteriales bacterium]MBT7686930.1 T9SS type B sorting domain-containing protein [Flavobacteriales bacterium]MBT7748283.1 T9SS type B sorting domain-containing protein [Flavobacteriales bacterium]
MNRIMNLLNRLVFTLSVICYFCLSSNLYAQTVPNNSNFYAGTDLNASINGTGDSVTLQAIIAHDCPGSISTTDTILLLQNCGGPLVKLGFVSESNISDANGVTTTCASGSFLGRFAAIYENTVPISDYSGCNPVTFRIYPTDRINAENLNNSGSSTSDRLRVFMQMYFAVDSTNSVPSIGANMNPYVCSGSDIEWDPQITDAEDDSLVISFRQPQTGASSGSNISYASGFTLADPIESGDSLGTERGIIYFTSPTDTGHYQIALQIQEYDKATGNLISLSYRDFQFYVNGSCTNDGPTIASSISNEVACTESSPFVIEIDTAQAASFDLTFTGTGSETLTLLSTATSWLNGSSTSVSTSGNAATMTVSWTPTAADVGRHVFTISAEDNGSPITGKSAQEIIVIVNEQSPPISITSVDIVDETCAGNDDGEITINTTGGIGPFGFQVIFGPPLTIVTQDSNHFVNLAPISYTVVAYDSSDGTSDTAYFQNVGDGTTFFSGGFNSIEPTCHDTCIGEASITTFPPSGSRTYAWDNSSSTALTTDLCQGLNIVTVTQNATSCSFIDTVFIVEAPVVYGVTDSSFDASCGGAADGQAYISGHGGFAFSSNTSDYVIDQTNGSHNPYPYDYNGATNFSLGSGSIDDGVSNQINIGFNFDFYGTTYTQFRISTNGFITFDNSTANGCCTGQSVPNTGTPNNLIAGFWEDLDPGGGGQISYYTEGTSPYRILVVNFFEIPHYPNNDDVTFQIVLYETSNIIEIFGTVLDPDGGNHTQGLENTGGTLGITATGRNQANFTATNDYIAFIPQTQAFSYSWPGGGTGSSQTTLLAGNYCVTLTDSSGGTSCSDTLCLTIDQPDTLFIDTTSVTQPACAGDSSGSITVLATGGDGGPYTYNWNTGATGAALNNLPAGTYTVTATDLSGCDDSLTVVLNNAPAITISFTSNNVNCLGGNDGDATASASGGDGGAYTYTWSTGATGATETGLTAGTYLVTAEDGAGCTGVDSITITEPGTAISVSITDSTDVTCAGADDGDATALATGGTGTITYNWSNGGTGTSITGLSGGTYTVTAEDVNGCPDSATVVITQPLTGLTVSIDTAGDPLCSGENSGIIIASGSSGTAPYAYAWSNGDNDSVANNLTAGTYIVTVTDDNGCTGTDSATLTDPLPLFAGANSTDPTCQNSTDGTATGFGIQGTAPYTFEWSNGSTAQVQTGLTAGTYTVTVTDDNGCTAVTDETISPPNAFTLTMDSLDPSCNGIDDGEAYAVVTGGTGNFTFLWNTTSTNDSIFGLSAGAYSVIVTDTNNCSDTGQVNLVEPTAVSVSIIDSLDPTCDDDDGEAEALATGGTGTITYTWSNGGNTAAITGLAGGVYEVIAEDANGCQDSASVTLVTAAGFVANGILIADDSCTTSVGSASVSMVGGSAPFGFSWSNGGSSQTITGLLANTYTVTVTDNDNCTDTAVVVVDDTCGCNWNATGVVVADVDCNGDSTGVATVTHAGAAPTVTYVWSNGSTNDSLIGVPAGTYTVTVTDVNGCTDTSEVDITQPGSAVTASISSTSSPTCAGGNDGQAVAVGGGGTSPYSYLWTNGETTDTAFALTAGTHTVTITDDNGCFQTASTTISDGTTVAVTLSTTNSFCFFCTGTATATVSGGSTPYIYTWSSGQIDTSNSTTNTQNALCSGIYQVTVTDDDGCSGADTATVSDLFTPTISTSVTDANCFGDCDGEVVASYTCFSCDPLEWFVFPDTTTVINTGDTFSNVCAGTYLLRLETGFGCIRFDTVIVGEPTDLILTMDTLNSGCGGSGTGQASVSVSGGTAPYSYVWNTAATTDTISNLTAGTYSVIVTDSHGCLDTGFVVITAPSGFTAEANWISDASCNGGNDGMAYATPLGGTNPPYDYSWSNGSSTNNSFTNDTVSFLVAGIYTVTITDDSGCVDTDTVNIDEPDTISIAITETSISCNGPGNDGTLTANASGGTPGYTYAWSTGGGGPTITGLTAGTYCVTATDNNLCQNSTCYILTVPTGIIASIIDSGDVSCNGGTDGDAEASATGGTGNYTYNWSTGATSAAVTGLTAGTYCVTVTDTSTSCTDTVCIIIDEPLVLTASIDSTVDNVCFNGTDGKAFASGSGGTPTYSFSWSNGSIVDSATALPAGMVTVTITDANGCTATDQILITEPGTGLDASASVLAQPLCNGDSGTVIASATGGSGTYTFLWPGGSTNDTTVFAAGTYCVTVTDGGICEDTACVTLVDPTVVSATFNPTNPDCPGGNDGTITANGTGGSGTYVSYNWSTGASSQTINGLTAGCYTVTVTDDNGCTGSATQCLTDPGGLTATFSNVNPTSCGSCNGSATVNVTGGSSPYNYSWPSGGTDSTETGLCAGIIIVTVTDNNGCADSFSVNVPNLGADTVFASVVQNTLCNGDSSGIGAASYVCTAAPCNVEWYEVGGTTLLGTQDTVTGLWAGDFFVQLTNDSGCVSFDTITITEPTPVVASIDTSTNVSCLGGSDGTANASGSGGTVGSGYTFLWPSGGTGAVETGLAAGSHCVTVTDGNGCSDTACVTITEPTTGLTVIASIIDSVSCNGGSDGGAEAQAAGGSGTYTYTWSGTSQIGDTINNLTAGTYIVTASDGGSCTATDTVVITEPTPIVITVDSTTNPSCPGDSNGAATVTASGGTPTYSYLWPSGNTGQTETNLPAGTYCVTVTDGNLCTEIECVTIVDPAGIATTFSAIVASSCTVCDGTATANPTGGNGTPFTFLWDNGQTGATNDSLCAGINTVTITDSAGCFTIENVLINADSADTVTASGMNATCGNCDGEVYATYTCTFAPCTVEWTNFGSGSVVGTTDTVTGLCAGTYAVELTNDQGCVSVDTITITEPTPVDPNAAVSMITCFGADDGSIILSPTGGSGTYTYTWSNGAGNTASNTNLSAGPYTVTIDDGGGCDTIVTFNIIEPTEIFGNETIANASCSGECDGSILLAPSGGGGTYTITWDPVPSNGNGTVLADSLCAGEHRVTITDIDGCSLLDTFQITEPAAIVQSGITITDATCGDCDGEISATYSGGAGGLTFMWSTGDTTSTLDSLCFGAYDLTVTDVDGCTAEFLYPVSETDGPDISLAGINASAQGACDGSATATVVSSLGTVTFNWSNGDNGNTADTLCAGTYIVTATDTNGCSTVDTITITEPTLLLLTFDVTEISCQGGGCDGMIVANVGGGTTPYTYAWSNGGTTDTISNLCAGTYTLTLTDSTGQVIVDSVVLADPQPFVIVSTVNDISCPGECDASISLNISGGLPPYSILWNTGDTTTGLSDLCAGLYSVTITDTAGCSDSLTFNLTDPAAITMTVDSMIEPDCQQANGMIGVTAAGGNGGPYTYEWLDASGSALLPPQNTQVAINLAAGIYNVRIVDSAGCEDTINVVLNNNNAPSIALDNIDDVSCFGECDGAVFISITGGTTPYSFAWSSGGVAEDDTALCAGPDTITVTDDNGCLAFDIYEIDTPEEIYLEVQEVQSVVCGSDCDGSITISAAGGTGPYTYSWSNGDTDTTLTDLCVGLYGLTVTDANNCEFVTSINVSGATAIVMTVDTVEQPTCTNTGDGSVFVTVTGDTPPYSYLWMGDNGDTLSIQDLTGALAGTYVLQLTDDSGCVVLDTFELEAQFFVEVTALDDFEVCPNDQTIPISATDSGATSVRWLNANGTIHTESNSAIVSVTGDTSMYVVEGINGVCVSRDTVYIYETDGPGLDAGGDRAIEPLESIEIGGNPTANPGVEVTWAPEIDISDITALNPTVYPLETITYYVFATDADGCSGIDSMIVTVEKVVDPVGGFSPNSDGVNDEFFIDRIDRFPSAVVKIFNRWGNPIFESAPGYVSPWNGTFQGSKLPVGTYYYIIDLNDDDYKKLITGPVTILK